MKVSFVISGFARRASGGHKIIFEYANYLVERGCSVRIYFLNTNSLANIRIPTRIKSILATLVIKYSKIKWFNLNPDVTRCPISVINDSNILDGDIIIACDVRTPIGVASLSPSKGKKLYLVQDFENWYVSDEYVYNTYSLDMKKIVISSWLKAIVDQYSQLPAVIIPDGINTENFKCQTPYFDREAHSICFHYRSSPIKGCNYAIEAIRHLKALYPDLIVKVVSNEKRPVELPDYCSYYYNISSKDVAIINNSVRVFMCTSINEGYGLPALEAMACGCSVVSTAYLGIKEYGVDGYNVLFSPERDALAMASNVKKLFENDDLAARLSRNGIITGEKFSNIHSSEGFYEIIKGV